MKDDNLVTIEVEIDAELLRQVKELIEPMGITVEQLLERFFEWLVHPDTTEEATAWLLKWKDEQHDYKGNLLQGTYDDQRAT